MFGIFKKKWRPIIIFGQNFGQVKVGTDEDATLELIEYITRKFQRDIELLDQAADARFKDTQELFRITKVHSQLLGALSSDALAKRDAVIGLTTKAEKKPKRAVKSPSPKKVVKKKTK